MSYPKLEDIFNVFQMPMNEVKVVILGQDPYPKEGQATGYAFAVPEDVSIPLSLKLIGQEIHKDEATAIHNPHVLPVNPKWRTLEHWRDEGVFLLNAALTVERNKPGSHAGYWNYFTHKVVEIISKEIKPVWLLWGANARGMMAYIHQPYRYDGPATVFGDVNYCLVASHPASERHGTGKFLGCDHFNQCNEILECQGKTPINW